MPRIIMRKGLNPYQYGRFYPYDTLADRTYGRLIAGIAWPGSKPGVIVVVGQVLTHRPPAGLFVLAVLDETEPRSLFQPHCCGMRVDSHSA